MEFINFEFPSTVFNGTEYMVGLEDHQVLRERREQLGLTQQQVADKARIQLRQYQRLESGERSICAASMRIGLSVCAVLKLNPFIYVDGIEEMNK